MTGDVWGEIPCPQCAARPVTVRETRKGTGKYYCPSCKGTGFYNESRATFSGRYGLEAPAEAPAEKKPRKAAAKKSTTKKAPTKKPTTRRKSHAPEREEVPAAPAGQKPGRTPGGSLGDFFGL